MVTRPLADTLEWELRLQLEFGYPDAKDGLNRWLPLIKWFLAIPHYVALVFLYIGVLLVVLGEWLSILFTGRYRRPLFA